MQAAEQRGIVTNGYLGQCNNGSILILKVSRTHIWPIAMW